MAMLLRQRFWLTACLALALGGCLFRRDATAPNWMKALGGPTGADVVVMDIAVLEVPAGDRYVNGELWSAADDQILAPEVRKRLDDNGLRVAKVSGRPPDGLLNLLTSERSNRNARQARKRANDTYVTPIGAQRDVLRFQLAGDGAAEPSSFEQAQCAIQITPVLNSDGKLQLQFVPQVQHADRKRGMLSPAIALALQTQRPVETFSGLRWEVPVGLNEYIVIGTRFDKPQSLGNQFLVTAEGDRPTQRVLAIRAGRLGQSIEAPAPLVGDLPRMTIPAVSPGSRLAIP